MYFIGAASQQNDSFAVDTKRQKEEGTPFLPLNPPGADIALTITAD